MVPEKPRSLGDILEALARRERLADALPYVAQLVSALALPPRKLERQELPVGGYADVTTRGLPERLLPSQFALDDLEFVRRFAENELLYFRREEPTRQVREELVVLLDQGVRTWGVVRLVLSAALLPSASWPCGEISPGVLQPPASTRELDPLAAEDEILGRLVEASDLSPTPAWHSNASSKRRPMPPRDVVLLTHPRALREADVQAAAPGRRATRLFALSVNDHGHAELAEVRHGTPSPVRQFQVDIGQPAEPKPQPPADPSAWTGDVEPIPFPFRFGISNASPLLFDFDEDGQWLLVASNHGMLHAFKLDDKELEILPRGMVGNAVLTNVERILGVRGGFVACGRNGVTLVAAHYDFVSRRCTVHKLVEDMAQVERAGKLPGVAWQWFYFPIFHSVVMATDYGPLNQIAARRDIKKIRAGVDLATGSFYPPRDGGPGRAQLACEATAGYTVAPQGCRFMLPPGSFKPYVFHAVARVRCH